MLTVYVFSMGEQTRFLQEVAFLSFFCQEVQTQMSKKKESYAHLRRSRLACSTSTKAHQDCRGGRPGGGVAHNPATPRENIHHEAADAVPHVLIKTLIKWWRWLETASPPAVDGGLNVAANFTLGLALISSNLAARRGRIYRAAFAPPNRT